MAIFPVYKNNQKILNKRAQLQRKIHELSQNEELPLKSFISGHHDQSHSNLEFFQKLSNRIWYVNKLCVDVT